MKKYKTLQLLIADIKSNKIPANVVSPGAAASMLGISRQAVQDRLYLSESLEAWSADGVVLISVDSIKDAFNKKNNIPESQGVLHGCDK